MAANLIKDLSIDECDIQEIVILLEWYFQSNSFNGRSIIFSKNGEAAIELIHNKKGHISQVNAGKGLTKSNIREIRDLVDENLFIPDEYKITRDILMSDQLVTGNYRYKNWFQICEAPLAAPRHEFLQGKNPAIVEVSYVACPHIHIEHHRRAKALEQVDLLLAFLINGYGQIWRHSLTSQWVNVGTGTEPKAEFLFGYYSFDGFGLLSEDFTCISGAAAMPKKEDSKYYSEPQGLRSEVMHLPMDLSRSISQFLSLNPEMRSRFDRACYWLRASRKIYGQSKSASYNAMAIAIETLLDPPADEKCPTCGKPKGDGPTQKFIKFLDRYLPENFSHKERGDLYGLRSKLTHGDRVMEWDGAASSLGVNGADEVIKHFKLESGARQAIYNWLHDDSRGD